MSATPSHRTRTRRLPLWVPICKMGLQLVLEWLENQRHKRQIHSQPLRQERGCRAAVSGEPAHSPLSAGRRSRFPGLLARETEAGRVSETILGRSGPQHSRPCPLADRGSGRVRRGAWVDAAAVNPSGAQGSGGARAGAGRRVQPPPQRSGPRPGSSHQRRARPRGPAKGSITNLAAAAGPVFSR